MPVSDGFRDYVLDQLDVAGPVTARRMFGGVGVYARGVFFAVMDDDRVYFRVDDATRPQYEARGSGPFAAMPNAAPMRGYYEVPAGILDDRDELAAWARASIAVAVALKSAPRTVRRRTR